MTKSRDKGRVVTTMKRAATVRRWAQMPGPSSHTWRHPSMTSTHSYRVFFYWSALKNEKMTNDLVSGNIVNPIKKVQNFLRVWHLVIF